MDQNLSSPFEENAPEWWRGPGIYARMKDGSLVKVMPLPDKSKALNRNRRTTDEMAAVDPNVVTTHQLQNWIDIDSISHKPKLV